MHGSQYGLQYVTTVVLSLHAREFDSGYHALSIDALIIYACELRHYSIAAMMWFSENKVLV